MPTEEESETKTPSISSRTRSQTRQEPIVTKDPTVQEVDDIFQSSSSSQAESEVSEFEGSDIEQTEQYNPGTLQFPTKRTPALVSNLRNQCPRRPCLRIEAQAVNEQVDNGISEDLLPGTIFLIPSKAKK